MKAKDKKTGQIVQVCNLNYYGIREFIALFDDGSKSSEYCRDYIPIDFKWEDLERGNY